MIALPGADDGPFHFARSRVSGTPPLPSMKPLRLFLAGLLAATAAIAQGTFPGLQKILTPAEWKRAGLDQLTPDQIGVIDAALIRYQAGEEKRVAAAALPVPAPLPAAGASPAEAALARSRHWERFGLEKITGDWRTHPAMTSKVTGWLGANRFSLDTGQVWEGQEPIPFELLGQEVVIEARPMGAYALRLGENSMSVRVRRVR